jgi:hypothetical protein
MAESNFEFGMRELYSCSIKATSNIEVNGQKFEANETIAAFDKVMVATFDDTVKVWTAHGGADDRDHVWWETTKDVKVQFTQGIFSNTQLALMTNRKLARIDEGEPIYLTRREQLESDDDGIVEFSETPMDYCFLYDLKTGERVNFEPVTEKSVKVSTPYLTVIADYAFEYKGGAARLVIGGQLTNGFFSFEGRTRVKDDITGQNRTGILHIPKLKLMSDISMRLGSEVNPVVGKLDAYACPVGPRGKQRAMTLTFLNDDIDTDM